MPIHGFRSMYPFSAMDTGIELINYATFYASDLTNREADLSGLTQPNDLIVHLQAIDVYPSFPTGYGFGAQTFSSNASEGWGFGFSLAYKFATSSSEIATNVGQGSSSEVHLFAIFRNVREGTYGEPWQVSSAGGSDDPPALSIDPEEAMLIGGAVRENAAGGDILPPPGFDMVGYKKDGLNFAIFLAYRPPQGSSYTLDPLPFDYGSIQTQAVAFTGNLYGYL